MDTSQPKHPESLKLPHRVDKTLQWLEKSRNSWKEKTKETKEELKKKKLAVRRARENRDLLQEELWGERRKCQEALTKKDAEIAELKAQLAKVNQQVEDLKKKR